MLKNEANKAENGTQKVPSCPKQELMKSPTTLKTDKNKHTYHIQKIAIHRQTN